jgi:hypothetical protein
LAERRASLLHFLSKEHTKVKIVKIMKYTSLLINKKILQLFDENNIDN